MNIRLNDGTVRCSAHFDAASYEGVTDEACLYCEEEAQREAPKRVVGTPFEEYVALPQWFRDLLSQNRNTDAVLFEQEAYRGYVSHGLSMTDGHFAPVDFETWVHSFRKAPVIDLYRSNDNRSALAPYVVNYLRSL
jgi:hypothetical protein